MCGAAFAQTPRVVGVVVVVESQQFRDGLFDADRKRIESSVAAALATELAKPFPIVDWRAVAGADTPAATLTAAVVEKASIDPNADPEINLVWRAKTGSGEFAMPDIKPTTLYKSSISDRPVGDAGGQFTEALTNAAVAWVNSETNQRMFKAQFLKHVLIANKVVTTSSEFVVLPLSYKAVMMSKDSVLLVKYLDSAAGDAQQKEFTLTGMVPRLSDPLSGGTQTHVDKCEAGGRAVPEQERWAKCVAPLNANPPKTVSVFVDPYNYDPHPDVESGIIVQE